MERKRYWGFTPEQRDWAKNRANGHCEFPAGCERKNTGKVNHITGSFEGRMAGFPRSVIQDVKLNSVLLCEPHEVHHDLQEREHIENILSRRTKGIWPSPFNAGELVWRNRR